MASKNNSNFVSPFKILNTQQWLIFEETETFLPRFNYYTLFLCIKLPYVPHKDVQISQAPVAHACNPNYSGGRDQEDHGSKPARGK
jgi:hypothetical protein